MKIIHAQKKIILLVIIVALFFINLIPSFAETVNYIYDDLNRLHRVEYGNGRFIEYTYDEVGNRTQEVITNPQIIIYTVTPSAGAGGVISPVTPQTVSAGTTITFTITPNAGYSIADVLVDEVSVGPVVAYTFSNVTASHTIAATFTSIPIPLYADFPGYGLYSWNGVAWTLITTSHPTSMVAAGSILYVDFPGDGFYQWNGTAFTCITTSHPDLMVMSGLDLYANFPGYGLYKWDGSGWTQLTNAVATNIMTGF
jgi:YD repeat-containing protein